MDLQTYIRNYGSSYSTKADKRDLIRQRHTPTRRTTRYERVLGASSAQNPTRHLRAYLTDRGYALPFKPKTDTRRATTNNQPTTNLEEI